jgi:hypothetical protein
MKVITSIIVDIFDANGKKVRSLKKAKTNSYVRQMIDILASYMSNTGLSKKDITGTTRTTYHLILNGGSGDASMGVVVGTGTTAVTISDYKLESIIANGTGSGQLQYGTTSFSEVAITGSTAKFTIARTFTNNSGASINVHEVGLYTKSTYVYCLERTLLDFTIENGQSGTVTYTISVTV